PRCARRCAGRGPRTTGTDRRRRGYGRGVRAPFTQRGGTEMTIDHLHTPGAALWVHAHPREGSLNDRLFREGVSALRETRDVATSDLYADGFDPALRASDLGTLSGAPGGIAELLGDAYAQRQLPDDVRREQEKVAAAE